jgi:predicted molibdopterin-dependent oxidoreductase YjgC
VIGRPKAVVPRETVTFTFDGAGVTAERGQSIAAALLASGVRSWRTTRVEGRPRGLFCGIGVCHDCLVSVNGVSGVRACLVEAHDGDLVAREEGAGRGDLAT